MKYFGQDNTISNGYRIITLIIILNRNERTRDETEDCYQIVTRKTPIPVS